MVTLVLEVAVYIEVVQKLGSDVQIQCLSCLYTKSMLTRCMGPAVNHWTREQGVWHDFFQKSPSEYIFLTKKAVPT